MGVSIFDNLTLEIDVRRIITTLAALAATFPVFLGAQALRYPQAPGATAQYYRTIGGSTSLYYWVVANFAYGKSTLSNTVTVTNTPGSTSKQDFVQLSWGAVPGAISYDVLKSTSSTIPVGSCTCGLITSITAPGFKDDGTISALSTYVVTTPQTAQFGSINSDSTAGAITLDQARILNSVLSHAPTGAVNDVTDSAANIVAAMPGCVVNATGGNSFFFILRNTSGGANTITVTAGSGVTLTGTMTVTQNDYRLFYGIVTSCTSPAVTLFSVGTGAY